MWAGAGIGAAASLPVYLFYLGDDAPPARRGLIFTGTATLLGIGVGALLGNEASYSATGRASEPGVQLGDWLSVHSLAPMPVEGGVALAVSGTLF